MADYEIALSFAGELRSLVSAVAARLASELGRDRVFYDRFHEAELARPNLDLYLQEIYRERSRLVVVFLGADYERKEWPGLEWRVVRDLIKSKRSEQIMLIRADEGAVPGVLGIDGYVDARGRDPGEVAYLILERLRLAGPLSRPSRQPIDRAATGGVTTVPKPPPHYLPRPEGLAALKALLLGSGATRLGITAGRLAVGVQGMGGVGKSVLASALALDEEVGAAFPDGVFWVALGQHPDLIQLQAELAVRAGGARPVLESPQQGKLLLERLLAERAVLLVLDDVWSSEDAAALDRVGPKGRLLLTARDADVLVGLGAAEHRVDVLSPGQAHLLLAAWAGQEVRELPEVAHQVARECGYLPLALALIGAMVRHRPGGWDDALSRLRRAELDKFRRSFPGYPYPDLLRAIAVSVEALEPGERERYLELAVVAEEVAAPEAMLETLWAPAGLAPLDARDLCAKLVARSLAQRDRDGRLRLHDLQADYLRHEAGDLGGLHGRLVDAYAARYPEGFHRGRDDGYLFAQLPYHLRGAGRQAELRRLLLDYRWIEAKLAATDINALLADYETPPANPELGLVQGALRLASHILVQRPEELAGQLFGRLLSRPEPTIATFLNRARPGKVPWLCPLRASLTPPGGPLVRILEGHSRGVKAVAVLPDGRVVSASADRTLAVWNLASGQTIKTLTGHSAGVIAVAALPGGRVVSASEDYTLRVWDLASGQTVKILEGALGRVNALTVLSDGRVVSASDDRTLRVWDFASGQTVKILEGHSDQVGAVAVLSDGHVVSASHDRTLRVWDLASGQTVKILEGHSNWINAVAVLPDGRVVSASHDRTLRAWDLVSGQTVKILEGHSSWVNAVAVLPDGRVVSGSLDRTLRVWDLASGQTVKILEGHSDWVRAVAVLPDGRVVSASEDDTLRVWDLASGQTVETLEGHSDLVRAVAVLPDGRVVSGSEDGTLRVCDLASRQTVKTLDGHSHWVNAVAVLPDGRVVSCSQDRTLRVWDLVSGQTVKTLKEYSGINEMAVLPDGRVVSGSQDGALRVWDLASGQIAKTLQGHSGWITAVAVLPDGCVVSASSYDRTLRVWDLASGQTVKCLEGVSDHATAVTVLPDGRVVSASLAGTLQVWDMASGQTVKTLEGPSAVVHKVAVLLDGCIVSASEDRTVRVWDLASGRPFACLTLDSPVSDVAVLPCRSEIVAVDRLGRLHHLRLEAGDSRLVADDHT
ncbi:MAG TPA: NB-ARC domain-containing protein [Thermoanaerobaculia bacterium]|nr:NB-ARC domain-containing protein [Thermoanaerobaculia bacterium]